MKCNCEEPQEINSGHYVEMMDRLHWIMSELDERIAEHILACKYPEIQDLAMRAQGLLMDAYQLTGNLDYKDNPSDAK